MNKINRFFKGLHRGQKGITGLETAIILIAFVTVASVLAYSVLSAGIFSSEKGKSAVYQGLNEASASMQIRGSVLALESYTEAGDPVVRTYTHKVAKIQFTVASALQNSSIDMTEPTSNSVVINYNDTAVSKNNITWTKALVGQERGTTDMLDPNEEMTVTVTIPTDAVLLDADTAPYSTFTIQIVPPAGAAITITRTLPAVITPVMDLN